VRRSAANEIHVLPGQLGAGNHFRNDCRRAEPIRCGPGGRIGNPGHRREENRRGDLDISNPEHETVSEAAPDMLNS
jgi:hypothetical protein